MVDEYNKAISSASVRVWNEGSFERPAFNFALLTDSTGYFETDSTFSYGCTPFQVEISASGFETTTQTYYPPAGEGWQNELPDEVHITLVRP